MTSAHFTNLAALIEKELEHAQSHIDVAVAWFTDPRLGQLLVNKARAKVQVRVVIRGDGINFTPPGPGKMDWEALLDAGATLYVAAESAPLHHKFCVVDRRRVVSGTYNWTQAAHNNLENVMVCDQPDVIDAFSAEFEATCGRGRVVTDVPACQPPTHRPPVVGIYWDLVATGTASRLLYYSPKTGQFSGAC